jgi:hypothetical protein
MHLYFVEKLFSNCLQYTFKLKKNQLPLLIQVAFREIKIKRHFDLFEAFFNMTFELFRRKLLEVIKK